MMKVVLERITERRLNPDKITDQVQKIVSRGLKGSRGRGWTFSIKSIQEPIEKNQSWSHKVVVNLTSTSTRSSVIEKLPDIITKMAEVGGNASLQGRPWSVLEPTGYEKYAVRAIQNFNDTVRKKEKAEEMKNLGDINLVSNGEFDHIFDRKHQINRIFNALELAKMTFFQKRSHCLLSGPPGCGKTEILESFKRMIGERDEAYLSFDGSNMTKAGVVEQIMEASTVPPVLIIEEIEKCEEQHLRWLMSIMDKRGEVRRTNYRVGTQAKDVRMVVLATANNTDILERYMGGAIASRFDQKIYCPRPNEKVMRQILSREIKGIEESLPDGNPLWVDKTIDFLFKKWGITDPRTLISFCTSSRDKLLTGEAQDEWESTLDPRDKKKFLLEKKNVEEEKREMEELQKVVNF